MKERSVLVLALSVLLIGYIAGGFVDTGYASKNAAKYQISDVSSLEMKPCDINGNGAITNKDAEAMGIAFDNLYSRSVKGVIKSTAPRKVISLVGESVVNNVLSKGYNDAELRNVGENLFYAYCRDELHVSRALRDHN